MKEKNLSALMTKEVAENFYQNEIVGYNQDLIAQNDEDIKNVCNKKVELLEAKRSLAINALYHGGQLISAIAKNDAKQVKNASLNILKSVTEGLTYHLVDKELALKNIPECIGVGVEWARKNPRGEIEVLVCASYIVSLLRDDNLVGNQIFAPKNYKAIVQLLETVLEDYSSSVLDILKQK